MPKLNGKEPCSSCAGRGYRTSRKPSSPRFDFAARMCKRCGGTGEIPQPDRRVAFKHSGQWWSCSRSTLDEMQEQFTKEGSIDFERFEAMEDMRLLTVRPHRERIVNPYYLEGDVDGVCDGS